MIPVKDRDLYASHDNNDTLYRVKNSEFEQYTGNKVWEQKKVLLREFQFGLGLKC